LWLRHLDIVKATRGEFQDWEAVMWLWEAPGRGRQLKYLETMKVKKKCKVISDEG
jgi:hypothetical protein